MTILDELNKKYGYNATDWKEFMNLLNNEGLVSGKNLLYFIASFGETMEEVVKDSKKK